MRAGHREDEGDVGHQTVAHPEHCGPGSPTLQVPMTMVFDHVEQRTERSPLRMNSSSDEGSPQAPAPQGPDRVVRRSMLPYSLGMATTVNGIEKFHDLKGT